MARERGNLMGPSKRPSPAVPVRSCRPVADGADDDVGADRGLWAILPTNPYRSGGLASTEIGPGERLAEPRC